MRTQTKIWGTVAILALVGAGFWFLHTGRAETTFVRPTPEQASKVVAVLSRDGDNDELKDWEEELWNTDALNPDTDADGTPDGEEIRQGRNPAKAGPDDTLDSETVQSKTMPGGGEWSETDRLSRELFAKYLTLKQSGENLTPEDGEKLVESFVSQYPAPSRTEAYTPEDITQTKEDSEATWHAYGNAVGAAVSEHAKKGGESDLIIFERALENEDEIDLANLKTRAKAYEELAEKLALIPAPESLRETALELVNSVYWLQEITLGMSEALRDSVKALSAATAYPRAVDGLYDVFQKLALFFEAAGVSFAADESGYILTQ